MNWLKAIGYGIILFAVMFLIGSVAMFGLKLTGNAMSVVMIVVGIIVLWLLAQQYKVKNLNDGIQVGLVWLVVDALLEYLVIVQMFNKGNLSFYTWGVITGYILVIIVPAVYGSLAKK
jgi:hypothetical protein